MLKSQTHTRLRRRWRGGVLAVLAVFAVNSLVLGRFSVPVTPCEIQKVLASDTTPGSGFGSAVAIAGNFMIVGSQAVGIDVGAVYVFRKSPLDATWIPAGTLTASDASTYATFGCSVAISGNHLVVGAKGAGTTGAAYVFVQTGLYSWTQQAKLTASDALWMSNFGESVGISGDTIVVGASGAFAEGLDHAGAAYIFQRSGSAWTEQAKLTAADAEETDYFGCAVAISGDGVIVGALFEDHDGIINAGAAYGFVRDGGWTHQTKLVAPNAADNDFFGASVALDGIMTLIGSPYADNAGGIDTGTVFYFERNGALGWDTTPYDTLTIADGATEFFFGGPIALTGDTPHLALVGAGSVAEPVYTGPAFLFSYEFRNGHGSWPQQSRLIASDVGEYNAFGSALAIDGNTAVIGAQEDDDGGFFAGAAYVFAVGPDCNGNAIADRCDIQNGTSQDVNTNGIPDECDPFVCPGDANHSGTVDTDDLVLVITNWGVAGANPGDIDDNGVVNIDDLVLVIMYWGACP